MTSLFPIFSWITRYSESDVPLNLTPLPLTARFLLDLGWFSGDIIAGLTVGIVLVPQSMSYAQVS